VNDNLVIIGGGLQGCITANLADQNKTFKKISIIESGSSLINAFQEVSIKSIKINNGFHGIDYPRCENLITWMTETLNIKLKKEINEKYLIVDGNIVNYNSRAIDWPEKLKKYFTNFNNEYYSIDEIIRKTDKYYLNYMKEISNRYSNDFDSSKGLFIPWFYPSDIKLKSGDEGTIFRNEQREKKNLSVYYFPENYLFSSFKDYFFDKIQNSKINCSLDTVVEFTKRGININNKSIDKNTTVNISMSPAVILKKIRVDLFKELTAHGVLLVNSIIKLTKKLDINFVEILVCDKHCQNVSRISKILNVKDSDLLQIESIISSVDELQRVEHDIKNLFEKVFSVSVDVIGSKISRKMFFPSKSIVTECGIAIQDWIKGISQYKISVNKEFGPINMAKTWMNAYENAKHQN